MTTRKDIVCATSETIAAQMANARNPGVCIPGTLPQIADRTSRLMVVGRPRLKSHTPHRIKTIAGAPKSPHSRAIATNTRLISQLPPIQALRERKKFVIRIPILRHSVLRRKRIMTPNKDAENKVRDRLRSVTVLGLAKSRFMRKYLPTAARGAGCRRSFGATTSQSRVVNAMRTRLRNSNARQSFVVLRRVGTARPPADGWNLDGRQCELFCRSKTDHLPA